MWLAHTRPDDYPEPYAFRPERFLEHAALDLHLDPVRRRRAPLHRRRRSPSSRCAIVLGEILRRFDLRPAGRRAEGIARRNVTFSPRHGTRIIATRR